MRVDPKQYPEAWGALETVAIGAGLPSTPPLYLIQDPAPNAFAAGRDAEHAYVAVTTGLLDTMPRRELEAVLAHEVSHVRNRDVRLMSLAAVLVGVIALVSDLVLKLTLFGGAGRGRRDNGGGNAFILIGVLAAAILAPIAASLLQLALSRRREYLADASAAEVTGDAEGMALALKRLLVDTKVTTRDHERDGAPLHRVADEPALAPALRGPLEHPPVARVAHRAARGGRRVHDCPS